MQKDPCTLRLLCAPFPHPPHMPSHQPPCVSAAITVVKETSTAKAMPRLPFLIPQFLQLREDEVIRTSSDSPNTPDEPRQAYAADTFCHLLSIRASPGWTRCCAINACGSRAFRMQWVRPSCLPGRQARACAANM
jgi:hypothetical protein